MSRIERAFDRTRSQKRAALIPFITAGDPDPALTVPLMHGLVAGGADIIELGVPFSDPMADGPTIQRASERALARGVGLGDVLAMVTEFRKTDSTTPVVLMGYANPIEHMGYGEFARRAADAGVDAVLTVDEPPEEAGGLTEALTGAGLDPIYLLAPTTPESRVDTVARAARGFVYYVSLKGVTGAGHLDVKALAKRIPALKARVPLPVGVGFGIRDAATAQAIAAFADAVVVGSRIVQEIESAGTAETVSRVTSLVRELRAGIDAAKGDRR